MVNAQLKHAIAVLCVVFPFLRMFKSAVIPGGITKIEQHDLCRHKELLEGLNKVVRLENAKQPRPVFKFVYLPYTLEATSQVVQGSIYRASVKLAPSKCRNDLNETREGIEACGLDFLNPSVLQQEKSCTFEIWSRPWLAEPERLLVQKAECKPSTSGQAQPYRIRWTMKVNIKPLCNLLVAPPTKPWLKTSLRDLEKQKWLLRL